MEYDLGHNDWGLFPQFRRHGEAAFSMTLFNFKNRTSKDACCRIDGIAVGVAWTSGIGAGLGTTIDRVFTRLFVFENF